MTRKEKILDAVKHIYLGRKKTAEANLDNYFNSAVGVGEHPGVVEECTKLVEEIDHCDHILDKLDKW